MSYHVSSSILQKLSQLLERSDVRHALASIPVDHRQSIEDQKVLARIEAPTFHEANRAAAFARMLRDLGLHDVHIDRYGNVLATRHGRHPRPAILIEAHLDTVFPLGCVEDVQERDGFLFAPGISDNTRGLAVILALVRALEASSLSTEGTLIFAGTTREEGAGGMSGMKELLASLPDLDASISIDSGAAGDMIYESTGMRTIEYTFHGKGGHAFGAFGQVAHPLHAAARAVARIADLQPPATPRTTFCVSNFHAGNDAGIHAIPPTASIKVNYRSNDAAELERLHQQILHAVQEACQEETARWGQDCITWESRTCCDIPAGSQDQHLPLLEGLYAVLDHLSMKPRFLNGGATNCSMAISAGIPALCMGTCCDDSTPSTFDHTLEERFPLAKAHRSIQAALLLALLCAGTPSIPSILSPYAD